MTLTEDVVLTIAMLGDERPHVACCIADRFFCGRPFHPELLATVEDQEDDCCKPCVDVRYEMLCPPHKPTHAHCPFDLRKICRGP